MDSRLCFSVLWLICCWIFCTVHSAPVESRTPRDPESRRSHVRTRRCSCRSFLDKECVYFCHLDILWVNTPERLVSYGVGDAPRSRRSLRRSEGRSGGLYRCECERESDNDCSSFCSVRP